MSDNEQTLTVNDKEYKVADLSPDQQYLASLALQARDEVAASRRIYELRMMAEQTAMDALVEVLERVDAPEAESEEG